LVKQIKQRDNVTMIPNDCHVVNYRVIITRTKNIISQSFKSLSSFVCYPRKRVSWGRLGELNSVPICPFTSFITDGKDVIQQNSTVTVCRD